MACNARDIGMSVISLGGGRLRPSDEIDHSVGFSRIVPLGTRVEKGDPIAIVHARDEASALQAKAELLANYQIGPGLEGARPAIVKTISP